MEKLRIRGNLTPGFINLRLGPFLEALSGMQHTIDEIKQIPPAPVSIHQIVLEKFEESNVDELESAYAFFLNVVKETINGFRSHLGAYTDEDVVSVLIEKELKTGKSLSEIQEILSGTGMSTRLANIRNDILRWEAASKLSSRQSFLSYENAEPYLGTTEDNPETEVIHKDDLAHVNELLRLSEIAELNETQLKILGLDLRGYSNHQIARELGIDVAAVYVRRSEALRKLARAAALATRKAREQQTAEVVRVHDKSAIEDVHETQNVERGGK